jgi:WD40 repeat protein
VARLPHRSLDFSALRLIGKYNDSVSKLELPQGIKLVRTLKGHTGPIGRIAWSPDGRMLASPSADKTIRVWDGATGECLRAIGPLELDVWCVTFDHRGRTLASGGNLGAIKLWEAATGKLLRTLSGGSNVFDIAFDPAGSMLASGGFDGVNLWWVDQGWPLREFAEKGRLGRSLAFDATGQTLVTGSHDNIQLWDATSLELLWTVAAMDPRVVAFDPRGQTLASASGAGAVDLWNRDSGKLIRSIEGHTKPVDAVGYSSAHRLFATKSLDFTVRIWSADGSRCLAVIQEPDSRGAPASLAFHPHLPLLATVGSDEGADYVIHIWEYDPAVLLAQAPKTAVTYTSAKIVLVGDSGVGKTGLGWRLKHGEFKEHPSTHGQQFWLLDQLGRKRTDGAECEAILWDLAGQPDYRLIHALFLDDADLALVLFDPTRNDDPLQGVEFWLKQLKSCPTILVAARSDRGTPRLTTEEIEAFCRRRGIGVYLCTSALRGEGVAELMHRVQSLIPWDGKPATVTTETFKRIKDYVLELKGEDVLLTPAELRARLQKSDPKWKFTDAEMLTAVGHLANHGYVTKLKTSKGEQRILLAPELLNNLAASFVLEARRQEKGLGSLEEKRLLSGQYPFPELEKLQPGERDVLLDSAAVLFLEHNVCFRETDPLTSQTYLIFPELINLKRPALDDDKPLEDGVAYTVTGGVENVYASLVVLLGYTHTFTRTAQWKNQARYEVGDSLVCGFRQEAEHEGELQFVLNFAADVPAPIRTLFQGLFESFLARRNLTVFRLEPVACTKGHQINRAVVREQLAAGADFAFCARCGERVSLPKADRPIQLTRKQAADVDAQRQAAAQRSRFEQAVFRWNSYITEQKIAAPECFISYAWGNPEQERWVEHSLASDLLKAGIKVVLDRWENRRIGASISRFVERAGKSDRVIVVGTPLYRTKYENADLNAPYVLAAEGDLVGARLLRTGSRQSVLPVLLEGTPEDSFPTLLEGRVFADFRKIETYFDTVFELILSIYGIPARHPVAGELWNLMKAESR